MRGALSAAPYSLWTLGPLAVVFVQAALGLGGAKLADVHSTRTLLLLGKSLALASASTLLAMALGIGTALWLLAGRRWYHRVARPLVLLPFLLPSCVYAAAWISLFEPGAALAWLARATSWKAPSPYGFFGAALILGVTLAPLVTFLVLLVLESVPRDLVEVSWLLGGEAGAWKEVLVPLAVPPALAGGGLVFALALVDYGVPSLMQFNVYSMEIYADFSQYGSPARAAWLSAPLLLAAFSVVLLGRSRLRSFPFQGGGSTAKRWEAPALPRGLALWSAVAGAGLVLGAFAPLFPLGLEAWRSGGAALAEAIPDVGNSLVIAAGAALASAALAWPMAWRLAGSRSTWLWALATAPLAVPGPLYGVAVSSSSALFLPAALTDTAFFGSSMPDGSYPSWS
jgi:iron(III) transport system permease protein